MATSEATMTTKTKAERAEVQDRPTPEASPRPKTPEEIAAEVEAEHQANVTKAENQAAFDIAQAERAIVQGGGIPAEAPRAADVERVTVETFARRHGRSPATSVFASEDRRINGSRKLPESEWSKLFDAFVQKPR
jgi:hypothetical protein